MVVLDINNYFCFDNNWKFIMRIKLSVKVRGARNKNSKYTYYKIIEVFLSKY